MRKTYTQSMQNYSFLIAIAGVLIVGAMSPGPSFMVVAQNTLSKSRLHGIATAMGTGLGVTLFALLASVGVTALLHNSPQLFLFIKVLGGLYLWYLAYRIWSAATQTLDELTSEQSNNSYWNAFISGLLTQCSNPKTIIVIAGIFAAFMPSQPPPFTTALIAMLVFIIDMGWYTIVAITLASARSKAVYLKSKSTFDRIAALFLALVGLQLVSGAIQ